VNLTCSSKTQTQQFSEKPENHPTKNKKPPKEYIHTCWDHRSLCLYGLLRHHPVDAPLKLLKNFVVHYLLISLAVQCVCTSQGEEFQTHPKRKKIEMELCCCTVASSCYTLLVSNNTYCCFFCWLRSFWCYFSVCH